MPSKQSQIKWRKGDKIKLGQAVSRFNKKINELESLGIDYTPSLQNYKELQKDIVSRAEFNRILKSLKRFTKSGAEALYQTEAGEKLTKWEYGEIKRSQRREERRLYKEASTILSGNIGMGNERLAQIRSILKANKRLENLKGYEFERLAKRIMRSGVQDRELRQAIQFKENYLNVLEEIKGWENVDKLEKKLNTFKNPISFYEYISQSPELMDLLKYYKGKDLDSLIYGAFDNNEQAFNSGLENLGLL